MSILSFNEPFEIVRSFLRKKDETGYKNLTKLIRVFKNATKDNSCDDFSTNDVILSRITKKLNIHELEEIDLKLKEKVENKATETPKSVCSGIVLGILKSLETMPRKNMHPKIKRKTKNKLKLKIKKKAPKRQKINKKPLKKYPIKNQGDLKEANTENLEEDVIVVDSDNEADEFGPDCLKWKFGGGIKIGNTFIYNKDYKPRALFENSLLTISFKTDSTKLEPLQLKIACDDMESIDVFFGKNHLKGCFRILLKRALTTAEIATLAEAVNNNRIDLHFNEVASMVEKGFIDRLKQLSNINALILKSKKFEEINHHYNTRHMKRVIVEKNKKIDGMASSRKLNNLKTLVTFPRSGINSVTITMRDLNFLKPGKMLNDSIVDFYLRYIASKSANSKIHIFNTFFYKILEKNPEKTQNWTKRVNIFEKDFIVLPVNEGAHWKAVVICFPLNASRNSSEWEKPGHFPRLVSLDSIKSHRKQERTFSRIRAFLTKEYELKFGKPFEFKQSDIKGIDMSLSKQANSVDCGVYLLEYIERFFEAPFEDTSSRIALGSYQFSPQHISEKRNVIVDLLRRLGSEEE